MPIYTGTADANGDFSISFGQNYTSGEKVTVIAEKDGATKSIELNTPAQVLGGGVIQFSGTMVDFPFNVGVVTLSSDISGTINRRAFEDAGSYISIWGNASGLIINGAVTRIESEAFKYWGNAKSLILPQTLTFVGANAFDGWAQLLELNIPDSVEVIQQASFGWASRCKKLVIGAGVITIGAQAFAYYASCQEVIVKSPTPPSIQSNTFSSLSSSCIFKVPASALSAYQSASNWDEFANRMIGI